MNVYSAHQTHDDENEIKNSIDTDKNQTNAGAGASIFSEPDPGLALAETPLFSENSNHGIYSNDPAEWTLTADLIDHFVQNPLLHGLSNNQDLSTSVRYYESKKRYVRPDFFLRKLANGELVARDWLIFSQSIGKVFCYVCKLFQSSNKDPLIKDGFNDWKNAHSRLAAHERSECHTTSIKNAHENAKSRRIDASIAHQLQMEQRYWREVLKRIVAVIKHLSSRGLAFRGDNEILGDTQNGNYLGSIELIAEFDPFLSEHLCKYGTWKCVNIYHRRFVMNS